MVSRENMASTNDLKQAIRDRMQDEKGTIRKDGRFTFAMLYPSPYRAGMSSLGYQLLYRSLNEREDTVAERVFLPDDVDAWRRSRTPLFSYEGERPLSHFNIIGVSLAYELEIPGLIECLHLAGLAPRARDRHERDPLVVLGGPLTFSNPLPASPFADVVIMGEADEAIHTLVDLYADARDRDELLVRLSALPGFFVPAIHGERLLPVIAADNAKLPAYGQIRTPHTELADMHLVESERGCHRKCTFCVMRRSTNGGMRLADPDRIMESIPEDARRVGLVGAAVSDHPRLKEILERIVATDRSFGLSSLRADRLDEDLMTLLERGGYRTLTVASDGASERLRIEMQKAIREQHLIEAAHWARRFNMRYLKLYMMVGVPGETDDDIDELIEFSKEVAGICRVALGIAPFVAKRNTPLDRHPFAGIKVVEKRLQRLQKELRGRVEIRPVSARWAWVEHALAQGGFDMSEAAMSAWKEGGTFQAWKDAIREHGRDEQPADKDLRLGLPEGRFALEGVLSAAEGGLG